MKNRKKPFKKKTKKNLLLTYRCDREPVSLRSVMGVAPIGEQRVNVKKTQ